MFDILSIRHYVFRHSDLLPPKHGRNRSGAQMYSNTTIKPCNGNDDDVHDPHHDCHDDKYDAINLTDVN